jgi:hypothetical protein
MATICETIPSLASSSITGTATHGVCTHLCDIGGQLQAVGWNLLRPISYLFREEQ